MGRYEI